MTGPTSARIPTLSEIEDTARLIAGHAGESPLITWPSSGGRVRLKLENLQPTGSFKIRGATAVLRSLSDEERAAGLVTPAPETWPGPSRGWPTSTSSLAPR